MIHARRLVSPAPHELVVEELELEDRPPPGGILARAAATAVSAGTEIDDAVVRLPVSVTVPSAPVDPDGV